MQQRNVETVLRVVLERDESESDSNMVANIHTQHTQGSIEYRVCLWLIRGTQARSCRQDALDRALDALLRKVHVARSVPDGSTYLHHDHHERQSDAL